MFRTLLVAALASALFSACAAIDNPVEGAGDSMAAAELLANPPEWLTAWYDYQTPADEHRQLEYFSGAWRGAAETPTSSQCSPGCEARMEMQCTVTLDGLFLQIESRYASTGCQSEGAGMKGFNRATGEYEWFYVKTTGSGMSLFRGEYDALEQTYTWRADVPSEMGPLPTRITERVIDRDTYELDVYQEYEGVLSHKVHTVFRRVP